MTDIQFGVTYPAGQQNHTPLGAYVAEVETQGFDSIWLIENLGSASEGLECLTTLGFMAACSTRLRIGTSVLLIALRNPVLLAQATASLDVLSGGRLILGVGVGDPGSHAAAGSDRRTRGRRTEAAMDLLRRLWTETDVTCEGEPISLAAHTVGPRPIQQPHPPLWVGGHSEAALDRAARLGDGFIPVGVTPAQCQPLFDSLDRAAHAAGRDGTTLTRAAHVYVGFAERRERAVEIATECLSARYGHPASPTGSDDAHLLGPPHECRAIVEQFLEAGVSHFIFDPVCEPDAVMDQLAVLTSEIVNPLRS